MSPLPSSRPHASSTRVHHARYAPLAILLGILAAVLTAPAHGFVFLDDIDPWPGGNIVLELQLGSSPVYSDGFTPNNTAVQALNAWNPMMRDVQFTSVMASNATKTNTNGKNNVFFDRNAFGSAFGEGVVAVTIWRTNGRTPVEADIVVNRAVSWDAYRGQNLTTKLDLRRILMHEMGHVLGLGHPDDHGLGATALMNSHLSGLDGLQQDDKDGATVRYKRGLGNPATAPTFVSTILGGYFIEGQRHQMDPGVRGSIPLLLQWYKDGMPLAGATAGQLTFELLRPSDTGTYFLRATNDAATVDSTSVVINVTPATIPVFQGHPPTMETEIGAFTTISAWAWSNALTRYTWYHDGAQIAGGEDGYLHIPNVQASDAGVYTAVATNVAGSVTSNPGVLTVVPTRPPYFTLQPTSTTLIVGRSHTIFANAFSPVGVRYQWTHDDIPIPGAVGNTYTIDAAGADHEGTYRLVASNVAGSVISEPASISVAPLPWPAAVVLPNLRVSAGWAIVLDAGEQGAAVSFQWYRNGKPIPGATHANLTIPNASLAEAGDYFVVSTNNVGSRTSTVATVTVVPTEQATQEGWLRALNTAGIACFLFENPARVERFDLEAEAWLPSIPLTRTPRSVTLVPGTSQAIVSYYHALARVDLAQGTEAALASIDADPSDLAVYQDRVYMVAADPTRPNLRRVGSISLQGTGGATWSDYSLQIGPTLLVAPHQAKAFFAGASLPLSCAELLSDGTFGPVSATLASAPAWPSRLFARPDGARVLGDLGTAYSPLDLGARESTGLAFDAVAFTEDGSCISVSGAAVLVHDSALRPQGSITLQRAGRHLALHGGDVLVFAPPAQAGGSILWEKKSLSEVAPPEPAPGVLPALLDYSADTVTVDRDGVLMILSRVHRNIFRWSSAEQRYLAPIPLVRSPNILAYSAEHHTLYLGYPEGTISRIDLAGEAKEEFFASVPGDLTSLCAADPWLITCHSQPGTFVFSLLDSGGRTLDSRDDWNGASSPVWSSSKARMFQSRASAPLAALLSLSVDPSGALGTVRSSSYIGDAMVRGLPAISASGQILVTPTGLVFDTDTMAVTQTLPHDHADAAWLGQTLYTARDILAGAELERWITPGYSRNARCVLSGRVLRLIPVGADRLIAVTSHLGRAEFTVLDGDLNVRTHFADHPDLTQVRLANLSTRGRVGTGDSVMIAGFVVNGTQPKRVLVRAIGPSLHPLGVNGELADPVLRLVDAASRPVGGNDDWATDDLDRLKASFDQVGAFPLPDGSRDAALIADLAPGRYTALVSGRDDTQGIALVETYDLDAQPGERRLINISTRAEVGVGDAVLIPGLVVQGAEPKRLLIRAVGPGLHIFGLENRLSDPQLRVMNRAQQLILANDNWGEDNIDVIRASSAASGAFTLDDGSRDAALVATLDPGIYTVVVSGVGDATGVALVEIYEVP